MHQPTLPRWLNSDRVRCSNLLSVGLPCTEAATLEKNKEMYISGDNWIVIAPAYMHRVITSADLFRIRAPGGHAKADLKSRSNCIDTRLAQNAVDFRSSHSLAIAVIRDALKPSNPRPIVRQRYVIAARPVLRISSG